MRIEDLRRIRVELTKVKPNKFVIPSPKGGEDEQTYISRCISSIIDEYGQEQASGICYSQWDNK